MRKTVIGGLVGACAGAPIAIYWLHDIQTTLITAIFFAVVGVIVGHLTQRKRPLVATMAISLTLSVLVGLNRATWGGLSCER